MRESVIPDRTRDMIMLRRRGLRSMSAAAGKVTTAGYSNSAGYWVVINHGKWACDKIYAYVADAVCVRRSDSGKRAEYRRRRYDRTIDRKPPAIFRWN